MGTFRVKCRQYIWVELSGLPLLWPFVSVESLIEGFATLIRLLTLTIKNRHPTVIIAQIVCHSHTSLPVIFDAALGNFAFQVSIKIFDTSQSGDLSSRSATGTQRVDTRLASVPVILVVGASKASSSITAVGSDLASNSPHRSPGAAATVNSLVAVLIGQHQLLEQFPCKDRSF